MPTPLLPPVPDDEPEPLPHADYGAGYGIPEAEALLASGALESDVLPPTVDASPVAPVDIARIVHQVFARAGLPLTTASDALSADEYARLAALRTRIASGAHVDDDHDPVERRLIFYRREHQLGRLSEG